jgi:hypothetical protein
MERRRDVGTEGRRDGEWRMKEWNGGDKYYKPGLVNMALTIMNKRKFRSAFIFPEKL